MIQTADRQTKHSPLVFGYIRASTDRQETSLVVQEEGIRGYCQKNNLPEPRLFVDEDVSGGHPLALREAGGKMCALLEGVKADKETGAPGALVIVTKLDRIFRSAADGLTVLESWERKTSLILADFGVTANTAEPEGFVFIANLLVFAEFERMTIARRIKIAHNSRQARGLRINGGKTMIYGTQAGPDPKDRQAYIHPNEFAAIKAAARLRDEGMEWPKVIDALFKQGFRARKSNWLNPQALGQAVERYKSGWYDQLPELPARKKATPGK